MTRKSHWLSKLRSAGMTRKSQWPPTQRRGALAVDLSARSLSAPVWVAEALA